jgi:hypothetical protein
MHLHHVTQTVVFGQLAQQCSKLHTLVAILDEFEQTVAHILLEEVQAEDDGEEIGDFLLE